MFALNSEELHALLSRVHDGCLQYHRTLATAESCTGGLLSALLTSRSGSSAYFLGGVCAYSNEVKTRLLGVPADLILEAGAVSEPVARTMAEGARAFSGADLSISVTGIAGPGGGSVEKPIGTVYCAWASAEGTEVKRLQLYGDRDSIRAQTCRIALEGVYSRILMLLKESP